jgi:hypothetical protein
MSEDGPTTKRRDLVNLVRRMVRELDEGKAEWDNTTLPMFLEALAGWIEDSPGYYQNRGEEYPDVDWRFLADCLRAAQIYE